MGEEKATGDDLKLDKAVTAHLRHHSGKIEEVKVTEPQHFDHGGITYMVAEPVSNGYGERVLYYDYGNPIPKIHGGGEIGDANNLTEEVYVSSILQQLSNPKTEMEFDIWSKLSRIPPWMFLAVLVVIILLNQGTLGGLLPF